MSINKELKVIVDNFNKEFGEVSEESRIEYLQQLTPNSNVMSPQKGKIYGDRHRSTFEESCRAKRSAAALLIDKEINILNKKMSEAPTQDAVNSVTMLSMRKNITSEEIQKLLDAYGDNDMTRSTIIDLAKEHNVKDYIFDKPSTSERIKDLEGLKRSLNTGMSIQSAEQRGSAFIDWLKHDIDNVFPED